jgi:GTPase SAR1 family protein
VGKSAILTRFSENAFLNNYSSTIGIDFNSRMIRVDHSICKLEIWDTAGTYITLHLDYAPAVLPTCRAAC